MKVGSLPLPTENHSVIRISPNGVPIQSSPKLAVASYSVDTNLRRLAFSIVFFDLSV